MPSTSPKTQWPFIGQDTLGLYLLKALSANRLPRALLFVGPRSLGKASAAVWLATADLCPEPNAPCGLCQTCRQIQQRQYPFMSVLDGLEGIGVDDVRTALSEYRLTAVERQRRWLVITDAEQMSESAANTLLKFLEELPPFVQVILTSSQPDQLLATVRSRVTTYQWQLVSTDVLRQHGISRDDSVYAMGRPGWVPTTVEREDNHASWQKFIDGNAAPHSTAAIKISDPVDDILQHEELFLRDMLLHSVNIHSRRRFNTMSVSGTATAALRQRLEQYLDRYRLSDNVQSKLLYDNLHLA